MLKNITKHPYIIGGIIVFLFMLFLGVYALEFSWEESLLASAVLSMIGVGGLWWKEKVWP
jgi:Kef-type K+ transport system membrane component KefB